MRFIISRPAGRREIKIAITHLWHAMGPQTMYHLIAKDKVAEQHI